MLYEEKIDFVHNQIIEYKFKFDKEKEVIKSALV